MASEQTELFPCGKIKPDHEGFMNDSRQMLEEYFSKEDVESLFSIMNEISGENDIAQFRSAITIMYDTLAYAPVLRNMLERFSFNGMTKRKSDIDKLRKTNKRLLQQYQHLSSSAVAHDLIHLITAARTGRILTMVSLESANASVKILEETMAALEQMDAAYDFADRYYNIIKSLPNKGEIEHHLILMSALCVWHHLTDELPKVVIDIYENDHDKKYIGDFVRFFTIYRKASCFNCDSYTLPTLERKLSQKGYKKLLPAVKQYQYMLVSMNQISVMPMPAT